MTTLDRIRERREELATLCERHGVKALDLFGSGTRADFDPSRSDLDFVVEFKPLPPEEHANAFFGLQEGLEKLFRRPVDLVEMKPIKNPYFKQQLEATRVPIYAAA